MGRKPQCQQKGYLEPYTIQTPKDHIQKEQSRVVIDFRQRSQNYTAVQAKNELECIHLNKKLERLLMNSILNKLRTDYSRGEMFMTYY